MSDATPRISVSPAPTEEEAAAIVASVEGAWPRAGAEAVREEAPRWRWSGRWWTKPVPLSRARPW